MNRNGRKPAGVYARLYCSMLRKAKHTERTHLAWRLYVSSILWCRDEGNDGQVPEGALVACVPGETKRKLLNAANELVQAGLWDPLLVGGWIVHDYGDHQDTSSRIAANRDRARLAAGQRWNDDG